MFIFRLISFAIRVVSAFILTLILQIQWDGKTLENYLIQFGKKNTVVKALNQVGQDGIDTIRSVTSSGAKEKKQGRTISRHLEPAIQKIKNNLALPSPPFKEKTRE